MKQNCRLLTILLIIILVIAPISIPVQASSSSNSTTITGNRSNEIDLIDSKTLLLDDSITFRISGTTISFSGTRKDFARCNISILLYSSDFSYTKNGLGSTTASGKGAFVSKCSLKGLQSGTYIACLNVQTYPSYYTVSVRFYLENGKIKLYDTERYNSFAQLLKEADKVDRKAAASINASTFSTAEGRVLVQKQTMEIIKGKTTDADKVHAIYQWIAEHIAYDYNAYDPGDFFISYQYNQSSMSYAADMAAGEYTADKVLERRTSICHGFASLLAAMARFAEIPALYISVSSNQIGHAINLLYYDGKWNIADSTWDCIFGYKWNTSFITMDNMAYLRYGALGEYEKQSSMLKCKFYYMEQSIYLASQNYSDPQLTYPVVASGAINILPGEDIVLEEGQTSTDIMVTPYTSELLLSSSDPACAEVKIREAVLPYLTDNITTQYIRITAKKQGTCIISLRTPDGQQKNISVQVLKASGKSPSLICANKITDGSLTVSAAADTSNVSDLTYMVYSLGGSAVWAPYEDDYLQYGILYSNSVPADGAGAILKACRPGKILLQLTGFSENTKSAVVFDEKIITIEGDKTTSIKLSAPSKTIYVGDLMFILPTLGNATKAYQPFVRFELVSGSEYAEIDPVFGLLKAKKAGKVVIKATTVDSGISAQYTVTIKR